MKPKGAEAIPTGGIRSFSIQRVRTRTGSGVRLRWGNYVFVLINPDGTPERSFVDADFEKLMLTMFRPVEQVPTESQKEGNA